MSDIDDEVMAKRKGKPLAELLRDSADDGIGCCHSSLCDEAAAEIERLRAALIQIRGFAAASEANNWRDMMLHIERQTDVLVQQSAKPDKGERHG